MSLEITPSLKGALAELYYREGCDQQGWAYVSLESIHGSFKDDGILAFRKGSGVINVRIMQQIIPEVKETSRPAGNSKCFVFDYLACRVGQKYGKTIVANPEALCWVKIGRGFSDSQIDALGRIKLQLAVFNIRDVLAPPRQIEMKWDVRPAGKWLDELDDLREQAESDDEYY